VDRKADRIKIKIPKPRMPIDSSSFAGDRHAWRRSPYSERNRPPFSLADFFPRLFRNVTIFRGVTFSLNSWDVKIAEQQHATIRRTVVRKNPINVQFPIPNSYPKDRSHLLAAVSLG
jgi:hypothetical protein